MQKSKRWTQKYCRNQSEFTLAQTQIERYENLNSIPGDIELQRIDISEFERMPYYSIDEASQPISQMTLEALDGAQTSGVGWDLVPTVSEAIEAGAEFASGSLLGVRPCRRHDTNYKIIARH